MDSEKLPVPPQRFAGGFCAGHGPGRLDQLGVLHEALLHDGALRIQDRSDKIQTKWTPSPDISRAKKRYL